VGHRPKLSQHGERSRVISPPKDRGNYRKRVALSGKSDACPTVVFAPPLSVDLRYASSFQIERFEQDEAYDVRTNEAFCRLGQYVEDFYNVWD
jgi:hypothetical protein